MAETKINITFQLMTENDLPEITELFNYYIENATSIFFTQKLSIERMRKLTIYDNSDNSDNSEDSEDGGIYKTFIIRCNDAEKICGYVTVRPHSEREAYFRTADLTIILRPDFTGKGIGGRALDFIEEYAVSKNIHVLIAGITSENLPSIRLFEKHNYKKCAHYKEVGQKFGKILDVVDYQKILKY